MATQNGAPLPSHGSAIICLGLRLDGDSNRRVEWARDITRREELFRRNDAMEQTEAMAESTPGRNAYKQAITRKTTVMPHSAYLSQLELASRFSALTIREPNGDKMVRIYGLDMSDMDRSTTEQAFLDRLHDVIRANLDNPEKDCFSIKINHPSLEYCEMSDCATFTENTMQIIADHLNRTCEDVRLYNDTLIELLISHN